MSTTTTAVLPVYDPANWVQTINGLNVTEGTAHKLMWSEFLDGTHQTGLSKHYSNIAQFTKAVSDGATYAVDTNGYITYYTPETDYQNAGNIAIDTTGFLYATTSKEVEAFRITFSAAALFSSDDDGYKTATVKIGIYYKKHTDTLWTCLDPEFKMSGKVTSEKLAYKSSPRLEYAKYDVLAVRLTASHEGSFKTRDTIYFKELTEIVYSKLRYNNTALIGLKIRATDQLSGDIPTVTSLVMGLKVAVPEGVMQTVTCSYTKTGSTSGITTAASAIGDDIATATVTKIYSIIDPTLTWNGHLTYEEGDLTRQTKYYSQNPVWCLYDLLTNTRYGLGNYYKLDPNKKGMILANFFMQARYCDELVTYTASDGTTMQRPRFTLNIVMDTSKSASEWIGIICAVMRANVYYTEGLLWLDIDRPKPITQIFNMSNVTEYSQAGLSYRDIPNAYEVQWINPDTDYTVDSFRLESKELQRNAQLEERKKALLLLGVTDFEQAKCLANYALLAGQYRTKSVSFKTNTDGLRCMVGDVIGLQHDVPIWGWGGVVEAYDSVTRTVTLSAGYSPTATYVDTSGATITCTYLFNYSSGASAPVTALTLSVDNWDGTERRTAILSSTPSVAPVVGDKYIIGEQTRGNVSKFKVNSLQRDDNEKVTVTATEYDPQLYTLSDNSDNLGEWVLSDYSFIENPVRNSVQGVQGATRTYQDGAGNYCTGVDIIYTAPANDSFWKSANLYYALVDDSNYSVIESDTSGTFFVPSFTKSGDYQFIVTSNYTSGKQTPADALSDTSKHPFVTISVSLTADNSTVLEGVSGLAISNMGNDGTFVGRDCVLVWKATAVIDADANTGEAGSEDLGAGTSTSSSWLSYYQVVIKNIDGTLRRTDKVYAETYTYTYENNHSDGTPARSFIVEVTTYDKLGRASVAKSITVSNPAPAVLT